MKRLVLVLALVLGALFGCDASENEARLFLERYDRLDPSDVDSRRALVEDLRSMPLAADDVRRTRDLCADLHESFLLAETASAEARVSLEAYQALDASEREPEGAAAIEGLIERSQAAVERANSLKEACLARVASLRSRYPRRER